MGEIGISNIRCINESEPLMKILGVRVDSPTQQEAIEKISRWIREPYSRTHYVTTPNPEIIMSAQRNEQLMDALNNADCALPDGRGLQWAAKRYKEKIKQRITGVDFIQTLASISPQKKWRWYLLGGAPGVAKQAANNLIHKYPGINIVKTEDGGTITLDSIGNADALVTRIRSYKPDILCVAFGAPKQEIFMQIYKHKLGAKVALGIGGTLDFISGKRKRAPKLIRILGFEWLYRLICEPRRIGRIYTAIVRFPLFVMRSHKE